MIVPQLEPALHESSSDGWPLYYLIAGEPSGDVLGAHLMRALRARTNGAVRFAGIGGEEMQEEGLASEIPIKELAMMGVIEVLPSARRLLRRIKETVGSIRHLKPVAVVTIDSSGFCHRVTEQVKFDQRRPVLVHYVAPMIWAWRPHRARTAARAVDHLLTLLPFEPPLFDKVRLPATYVGHPVIESDAAKGDGKGFRLRHGINPTAIILCVLPGSRRSEVHRLLPTFGETVARLAQEIPDLVVVMPTVETVKNIVAKAAASWLGPDKIMLVDGKAEKFDAFAASDAALTASGSVSLELAMASVPMVVGYKILPATHFVVSRVVKIAHATLANILLGRPLIEEFLQDRCTPVNLVRAVKRVLFDAVARQEQIDEVRRALEMIGRSSEPPSLRAADKILQLVSEAGNPGARQEHLP